MFKQEDGLSNTGGRYQKVSEDYDTISQGGWFDKVLKVTIEADSEEIDPAEASQVAWAKSIKEGGLTLKGIQYMQVRTEGEKNFNENKEFSHVLAAQSAGGDADNEEDSAKTVFMAVGALASAFAALTM